MVSKKVMGKFTENEKQPLIHCGFQLSNLCKVKMLHLFHEHDSKQEQWQKEKQIYDVGTMIPLVPWVLLKEGRNLCDMSTVTQKQLFIPTYSLCLPSTSAEKSKWEAVRPMRWRHSYVRGTWRFSNKVATLLQRKVNRVSYSSLTERLEDNSLI